MELVMKAGTGWLLVAKFGFVLERSAQLPGPDADAYIVSAPTPLMVTTFPGLALTEK
jgi:hypothetical protein